MNTKDFLKASSAKLEKLYEAEEASAIVKVLLESVTSLSNTDILLNAQIKEEELQRLTPILTRLENAEPLQYILGEVAFYGLTLKVAPGVLIPRPETEELVDYISQKHQTTKKLTILDCCTGSGCIALALAKSLKEPQVSAIEISKKAISIASENASNNRIKFNLIEHDLLSDQELDIECLDIIVSNPPYVTNQEKALMHQNVLDYEPELALFVEDENPLIFYKNLLEKGSKWLKDDGWIYFEINEQFGEELIELADLLGWQERRVWKDLRGKNRFFEAKKRGMKML